MAGLVPSEGSESQAALCLSPGSWSWPELLSVPCLGYIPASLSSPSHAVPPESSQDCLYKQTSVIGLGAYPIQVWLSLNLNNYICKAPISKEAYIVRYEGLGLQYIFKRCLLLGRKAMKNLDSILKSRDITLQTKVHIVKVMVFPVGMYECESWTTKKAEHLRTDAFELWC